MIPVRVYLEGFLCYRKAQEVCFEGCSLWLLAGANGSGKSAIFDAVTWVLFGQHRGGRHHARGLINQQSDRVVVEFDFRLDEDLYRAHRTLSCSGRSTRQIYRAVAAADDDCDWNAILQTDSERGFGDWIEHHVGMTYDTFTASVLLLQGRADNLLQAYPAQRHQLLSQVVGLERFEQLHERAKQHLSAARGSKAQLRKQLGRIPRISAKQLARSRRAVEQAEAAHRQAAAESDRLAASLGQARHCQRINQQHRALVERRTALHTLLRENALLKGRLERRELLAKHVPELRKLARELEAGRRCRSRMERLEQQHSELRKAAKALQQTSEASDVMLHDVQRRLEVTAARLQTGHGELAKLTVALAVTERRSAARDQLRRLRKQRRRAQYELGQTATQRDRLVKGMNDGVDLPNAQRLLLERTQQMGRLDAVLLKSRQSLQRLTSVAHRDVCPYCQQALPPSHLEREHSRLDRQLHDAERDHQQAQGGLATARRCASQLEAQHSQLATRLQASELQLSQYEATLGTVRRTATDAIQQYREARDQLLALADGLPHPVSTRPGRTAAKSYLSSDAIRAAQQRLQTELRALEDQMATDRRVLQRTRDELERAAAERSALNARIQCVLEELATVRGITARHRDSCLVRRASLPAGWQGWSGETIIEQAEQLAREERELSSGDWAQDAAELLQSRAELQETEIRLAALREQFDCGTSELSPHDLQLQFDAAVQQCEARQSAWHSALLEQQRLEETTQRRREASDECQRAEHLHDLWGRLVKLLGREGLQRSLLQRAERVIVDYANATLDRLGGGGLYLELRSGEQRAFKALDLLARTEATAGQPQDVAFLSGSQKFRVAVSLSLAIGQYASRTRRPVQAVFIDEGFGCLDTVNRQVMIQELQNLQNQLQRIVLVSHQDEFFNAFPDGFRCELIDGATRLTPFHR